MRYRLRARLAGLATIVAVTAFGIVVAPRGPWAAGSVTLTDGYVPHAATTRHGHR